MFAETPTEVSIRAKSNRSPRLWAILAGALVFVGVVAALLLSSRESSSNETNQTPVAEATPAVKANRKTSEGALPSSESVAETKTKSSEKKAESRKTEQSEADRAASAPKEKQASTNETSNSSVDEQATRDSDDETDDSERERPDTRNDRRPRRVDQTIPDEMSEEEFQQLQRDLKRRRLERRKKPDEF